MGVLFISREELSDYIFTKVYKSGESIERKLKAIENINYRKTYFSLEKYLNKFLNGDIYNRFIVMPGLRGTGKTTILFQLYQYLKNCGINEDRILYISLDETKTYLNADLYEIINVFISEIHEASLMDLDKKLFILVDEAHFDKDWSLTGKIVYDQNDNIFLLCTGSSALSFELNVDAVRRIHKEPIFPMSFQEYHLLKNNIKLNNNLSTNLMNLILTGTDETLNKASEEEKETRKSLLKLKTNPVNDWGNYLLYQDFPFSLYHTLNDTYERLFSTINKIIEKDVFSLKSFNTNTKDTISRIIIFLALQKPGTVSDVKLADSLNKSSNLIRDILNILEKTHLIFSVKPYGAAGKIIRKSWKYYFLSPSINASIRYKMGGYNKRNKQFLGILSENLVASHIFHMNQTKYEGLNIFYDSNKQGVDFILQTFDKLIPVEVGIGKKDTKQIKKAINRYKAEYGIIISNKTTKIIKEDNVIYIPLTTFSLI